MKLYNPFKPHIIQFDNNCYSIRRFSCLGWEYCDTKDNYWWSAPIHTNKYSMFNSIEAAQIRLKSIKKYKVTKVIHDEL